MTGEDQDRLLQKYQQEKERFLKEFPQVKQELKESIRKLRELADSVDKVHRDCTISNVVASSTGIASGALSILGLVLAPFTAGLSLGLSAAGIGLGAAAAVTIVSTSIFEHVNRSSAEIEASRMMSTVVKKWKVLLEVLRSHPHTVDTTEKVTEAEQCIEMHIHALETGNATLALQPM